MAARHSNCRVAETNNSIRKMTPLMKTLSIASAVLLAATAAFCQTPEGPPPRMHQGPPMPGPGGPPPDAFMGGMEGRTVAGAPFSAQTTSTFTQTLSDGSHISKNVNASIARDGQGRTYRQQSLEEPLSSGAGKSVIFVHDPVAHTSHMISSDSKTDLVTHMPPHRGGPHGPDAASASTNGPRPEMRPRHTRPNETVESLAPQMIEGVWAEGTRITHTIPAGSIGNEHELKVVSETWYSKDLQMVVMSKHSDPRSGESTFKLTNVQRAEPDASLFQTPAGFKVTEHGRGAR
jgi:hypothetical protein